MTMHQDELQGILQVLSQIARTSGRDSSTRRVSVTAVPSAASRKVYGQPGAVGLGGPSSFETTDKPTLMKLAEHIAVRFALENYERGDLKVDAVKQCSTRWTRS